MFVSDQIVFIELHKTGCTHIRNLLAELVGGEFAGKHNQADPGLLANGRVVLGSVRDPWDWYVSLWAYGCDRRGLIYGNVTRGGIRFKGHGWKANPYRAALGLLRSRSNKNARKWSRTYQDVDDPGAFREWLHMMHDPDYWSDFGEGYGRSAFSSVAGLYTYRYARLFSCTESQMGRLDAISTFDQLERNDRDNCFVDHFIRNENLETDLFAALQASGFEIPGETRTTIMQRARTNTSSRKRGPDYYYDQAAERLVGKRERLLVEKFGYVAPGVRESQRGPATMGTLHVATTATG